MPPRGRKRDRGTSSTTAAPSKRTTRRTAGTAPDVAATAPAAATGASSPSLSPPPPLEIPSPDTVDTYAAPPPLPAAADDADDDDDADPQEPVTIDHRFFGHLWDDIIAQAPPAALLTLRATSRGMRDRIDGILARHLRFEAAPTPPPDEDDPVQLTPRRRRFYRGVEVEAVRRDVLVKLPNGDKSGFPAFFMCGDYGKAPSLAQRASRKKFEAALASTRVVDVIDAFAVPFARSMSSVEILRFLPDDNYQLASNCPIKAKTCIVPLSLLLYAPSPRFYGRPLRQCVPTGMSRALRRFVVPIKLDPSDWTSGYHRGGHQVNLYPLSDQAPQIAEVVLIFLPGTSPVPASPGHVSTGGGVLAPLNAARRFLPGNVKYTIVGALELPQAVLGIFGPGRDGAPHNEVKTSIMAKLDEPEQSYYWQRRRKGDDKRGPVTFMTLDEYRGSVSAEEYALTVGSD